MSVFQFAKLQRVIVPLRMAGAANVQGIVTGGYAELGKQPQYVIQWPNIDKLSEEGGLPMIVGDLSQDELIAAQPPRKAIGELKVKIGVDTSDLDVALKKAKELDGLTARKRKKPAKAKSKSKRKH